MSIFIASVRKSLVSLVALVVGVASVSLVAASAQASTNQVQLVGELNVGAGHSFHSSGNRLIEYRDRLFFWANDGSGFALWSFDGNSYAKPATDASLAAGEPGVLNGQSFAVFQDRLYFNGTRANGTQVALFVFDGEKVSLAHNFTNADGQSINGDVGHLAATPHGLFLAANGVRPGETTTTSRALWRWDGSQMHFVGSTGGSSSNTQRITWLEDRLYFAADGPLSSWRPWVYDPTQDWSAGTLNTTTNPGDLGVIHNSSPFVLEFAQQAGMVYFSAYGRDAGASVGRELWRFDPALPIQAETDPQVGVRNPSLVADLNSAGDSNATNFVHVQDWLFFRLSLPGSTQSIYAIDPGGQLQDTTALSQFLAANAVQQVSNLTNFGNRLVFATPFSPPVTVRTFDRETAVISELFTSAGADYFAALTSFRGELYWIENSAAEGRELYRFGPVTGAATIDPNPLVLPAISSGAGTAAPSYSGPIVERVSPNPAFAGEMVEISGLRPEGVSALSIDGQALEIAQTDATLITARLPETLSPGLKDLVATSSSGSLTAQGALEIAIGALSVTPTFYTKMNLEQGVLKIYARNVVGVGKVQFFANGREVAWVRAADAEDARLNLRAHGMVRSVPLAAMLAGKNSFEIHVDGHRVLRRAHTR